MMTIKLSNKLFYSLITLTVILLIGTGVLAVQTVAPGTAANPGHNIADVGPPSGCSSGQYLQYVVGSGGSEWRCSTPSTSIPPTYVRNVEIVSFTRSGCSGNSAYIACPSGKEVIGGGCGDQFSPPVSASYPLSEGWQCYFEYDGSGHDCTAYAICANVD